MITELPTAQPETASDFLDEAVTDEMPAAALDALAKEHSESIIYADSAETGNSRPT